LGIQVYIHKTHRNFTDGLDKVEVEGSTVGECLRSLVNQHPHMKDVLFDKKEKLLNVIEIYVNQESAYPEEEVKPVNDGDRIHLTVMLAGG